VGYSVKFKEPPTQFIKSTRLAREFGYNEYFMNSKEKDRAIMTTKYFPKTEECDRINTFVRKRIRDFYKIHPSGFFSYSFVPPQYTLFLPDHMINRFYLFRPDDRKIKEGEIVHSQFVCFFRTHTGFWEISFHASQTDMDQTIYSVLDRWNDFLDVKLTDRQIKPLIYQENKGKTRPSFMNSKFDLPTLKKKEIQRYRTYINPPRESGTPTKSVGEILLDFATKWKPQLQKKIIFI